MRIAHAGLEPPQATNLTLPSLLIALLAISVAAASALATPRRQENNLGSGPIELSAGALEARALRRIECQYPQLARAAHISGTVVVRVVVDEGGNPISAWAMTGHPLLTYPATVAARGWRFTPIRLAGVPVQMTGPIVFDFNLHRRTSYVGLDRDRIGLNDPVDLPLGQGLLATAKFLDDQISALAKECPRMIKSLRGGPVYRITGRVIDDQTAAPLSNATVYLSSLCPMVGTDHLYEQDHIRWQTVTGQDGTFALDGVPSMEATLSAARDGYILVWPFRRTVDAPGPKFVVMPGGVVQRYAPEDDSNPNERVETERANPGPLTLRMAHAGSVVVTVRGPDGKRLPNATVLLGMYSPGAGIRHIEPSTRYPVEPALVGVYRYDRLAPGRYYVLAACNEQYCSELSHDRNGNVIGLLPARFPRPTSRNNDPFLKLEEGQHRNVEIQLHRGRFHQVTITTSGVDAWPYSLEAVDSNRYRFYFAKRGGNCCEFDGWLPRGGYRLYSPQSVAEYGRECVSIPLRVEDADISNLLFPLADWGQVIPVSFEITGLPSQTLPESIRVWLQPSEPVSNSPSLWVQRDDSSGSTFGYSRVDIQGPPSAGKVYPPPGSYSVVLLLDPRLNRYVESITSGGRDLIKRPLVVEPATSFSPIRINLAEGATVEGAVEARGRPARVWVYAIATQPAGAPLRRVLSGPDGRFVFTGLAPIEYVFFASNIEFDLDVHDRKVMNYFEHRGEKRSLQAGGTEQLSLPILRIKPNPPSAFYP